MRRNLTLILALGLGLAGCAPNAAGDGARGALTRAQTALAAGRPGQARVELLNAIKADPTNPAYRLAQAQTYLVLGNGTAAEAEIVRARQLGSRPDQDRHLLADALAQQGRAEEALNTLKDIPPAHRAHAARVRGRAHSLLGERAQARAAFDQAIAATPNDPLLWIEAARHLRSIGRNNAAMRAADRAIALQPTSVAALRLRGQLAVRHRGHAAALPWFDRALAASPNDLPTLLERAESLGELDRGRELLAVTRKVLLIAENNPEAYFHQAHLAAKAGKYRLARALLQRMEGKLARQPRTLFLTGVVDAQLGNPGQAAERLELLIRERPRHWRARRVLAASYWRMGDAGTVIAVLTPLVRRQSARPFELRLMARALERQGDKAAADVFRQRAGKGTARRV